MRITRERLFLTRLQEAESLMDRGRWTEAREVLEDLDRRFSNRGEVLGNLVDVYYELKDFRSYEGACERLLKLIPDDPDLTLMLAGAYLTNLRPVLALHTFRRFLQRWPDHERATDVQETIADLEARIEDTLKEIGVSGKEGLELAELHERMQSLLDQGMYEQARKVGERLLQHRPEFIPGLNNLSQIHFLEGRFDQAIDTAQRVLSIDPDNFHALSNLTRYLCLSGRVDEAREWAERLKAVESDVSDVWTKKAEALSYLGDDQGVLDAFEGARQAGCLEPPLGDPMLYHLAAVAAMRQGREKEARRYWEGALKLMPGFQLARANLDDLRKPVGERHAPWPFGIFNWVTKKTVSDVAAVLGRMPQHTDDEAVTRAMQRYLRRHPEIAEVVPLLLDRGDPKGREFALNIAMMANTPEMLEALRDFALSQRGPDAMRNLAAHAVAKAGLLPSGPIRLWLDGEWREILLLGFELHDEPSQQHSPQVEKWLAKATLALRQGKAKQAEKLLKRALEIEPDAPDLLNNLAAAYELQSRSEEAYALVRQVCERYPDYVFARTGLAQLAAYEGKIEEAKTLLEPLLSRQRFHYSEFAAVCRAQIEVHLAEGNLDAARSWLEMWENADPDNPDIEQMRRRLRRSGLLRRFLGQRK